MAAADPTSYSADDMQVLEGLAAVRKRPGMYIGPNDSRGLNHLLWEVVDNAVDEAIAGHCDRIEIFFHPDGSLEVHDNGRGIPVDVNTKSGLTGVEIAFTKLHGGGKFGGSGYAAAGGLHGVGAAVVNALSSKLSVEVDRNGKTHEIAFRDGTAGIWDGDDFKAADGLRVRKGSKPSGTGTRVRYWPSAQAFTEDAVADFEQAIGRARQTAFLVPGLLLVAHDLRGEKPVTETFAFDGGVLDFVQFIAGAEPIASPMLITGEGTYIESVDVPEAVTGNLIKQDVERTMGVEIALQWVNDYDPDVRSFANIISTTSGGTHVTGFERAITKLLKDAVATTRGLKGPSSGITKEDVMEGLRAVVLVRIAEPQFDSQTKSTLSSPSATKIVQDVVTETLQRWLKEPKDKDIIKDVKSVLAKVAIAGVTREQVRAAKDTVRRKNALESAGSLPTKLADCRSGDQDATELFIVEGDSAGGTVKAARDSDTQALLPLRGKLLNVQKVTSEKRMLDNRECEAIIAAIGGGAGKTFDVDARRYGRVVLLTDADVDGSHIRTLVLALLHKYTYDLVLHGHVYAAVPPLYRTEFKGKKGVYHYTFTEDEQRELIRKHKNKEVREMQRFKGLGEMDADQMELVIGAGRTMRRLTLEDTAAAAERFELLMGSEVEARRNFIVANALNVKRIDA